MPYIYKKIPQITSMGYRVSMTFILCLALQLILLTACASSSSQQPVIPEMDDQAKLVSFQSFESQFLSDVRKNRAEALWGHLRGESQIWLEDMILQAQIEEKTELSQRPFFEQLTIMGVRHSYLTRRLKDLEPISVVRFLFTQGPIKQAFHMEGQTQPWFEGNTAMKGLQKASQVPIYFYQLDWDDSAQKMLWKVDIVRMLPLISRGVQTLAHKKKMTYAEAIPYLIGVATGRHLGAQLLEPLDG